MKKGIFALFAVLFVCFFLLCACEISDETSYSCATSENGKPTVYSLTFTGETGISLTQTTSDTSVTYSGTYTLVSKDIYRVALTSASDNSAVPSRLKEITITLDGSSFSIRYNDATPTETHTVPATIESKPADPSNDSSTAPTPSIQPDEQPATPTEKDPPVPTDDQTVGAPEQPIGEDPVAPTPSEPNEQETPALPEQTGENPSEPEPTTPETPTNPQTPVPEEETPTTDPVVDPVEDPQDPDPSKPTQPNIDGDYTYVLPPETEENSDSTYNKETTVTKTLKLTGEMYTLTDSELITEEFYIEATINTSDGCIIVTFLSDGSEQEFFYGIDGEFSKKDNDNYYKYYVKELAGKKEEIILNRRDAGTTTYTGRYRITEIKELSSVDGTFDFFAESATVRTDTGSLFVLNLEDNTFVPADNVQ